MSAEPSHVPAGLSPAEIQEHVHQLAAAVPRLRTERDLTRCAEVAEHFGRLRTAYRSQPAAFAGVVPELTRLRRDCEQILDTRLVQAVDRFQEISETIRRAEAEREFLREFFIRKASQSRGQMTGTTAEVTVRSTPTREVPHAGSDRRVQLERLLQRSGV
ncbi:MAG: hypothetical protein AB1716_00020 [Planctomycetota bacterium]